MTIGQKIHQLRKQANLGLKELAQKSGVGLGTLSRIENDKTGPTGNKLETHRKICEALGITLPALYGDTLETPEHPGTVAETAPEAVETFTYDEKAASILLANGVLRKNMLPQLLVLQPGGATHVEQTRAGCEKWLFVLEGVVEVQVGEQAYPLKPHGTLYFQASLPHHLRNPGTTVAKCLSVTSPVGL